MKNTSNTFLRKIHLPTSLRIALFLCTFYCLLFTFVPSAQALDLTKYFFPTGGPGNNMSTGEFFKVIPEPDGYFRIQKSVDPRYYERFRVQNGMIYHVEEATWATEEGNVKCLDNGADASATYAGGQTEWAPVNVTPGVEFDTLGGEVVGVEKGTTRVCPTKYAGGFGPRRMKLSHQGCVTFPNGVTSDDAIVLDITQGPGIGEQFIYDVNRGWIGFSRDGGKDGAYITDTLSTATHAPGECKLIQVTAVGKRCPAGYTCPKNSTKPTLGEKIPVSKLLGFGSSVASALRGLTGPVGNIFTLPDLKQEDNFFSSKEFFNRTLTDSQQKEFVMQPKDLEGKIAHPGCDRVIANGQDAGLAETNPEASDFKTTPEYNRLLLANEYWRCTYVNGYDCKLKFTNAQTNYGDPSANSGACLDNTGQSIDQSTTLVDAPAALELTGTGVLDFIGGLVRGLKCIAAVTGITTCDPAVMVDFALQQQKFIPNETEFDSQTVNKDGWLNAIFKTSDFSYNKSDAERDQDEKGNYVVLNEDKTVGTTFKGVADFQKESINFRKSLYVEDLAKDINSLASVPVTSSSPTVTTTPAADGSLPPGFPDVPYRNTNVPVYDEQKKKLIEYVQMIWPNSLIASRWDLVYNTAIENGINPSFMIATWIEESGASSPGAKSDFGCFPGGDTNLNVEFGNSMRCFVDFTTKEHPNNFADWVKHFCGPLAVPVCSNNGNYVRNFPIWYDWVTGRTPIGTF